LFNTVAGKHPDERRLWVASLSLEQIQETFEDVLDHAYEADGDLPIAGPTDGSRGKLADEYYPPEYVAESCGLSAATVRRVRRIAGQDPETGASEPDERLAWLVELYALGMTVKQLSELAGVSNGTTGRILKGESRLPKNYDGIGIPELLAARTRLSERAAA
jgi:hypothetical protein